MRAALLDEKLLSGAREPRAARGDRLRGRPVALALGSRGRFDLERRSHRVLWRSDALEIALFGWAAGQDTLFHDHGGASGRRSSAAAC